MPYRFTVPLVLVCKFSNVPSRNLANFHGSGESITTTSITSPLGRAARPAADGVLPNPPSISEEATSAAVLSAACNKTGMNSTYFHDQCYRRNGWMRGSSAPQLMSTLATRCPSECFVGNGRVDQRMVMSLTGGQQVQWRAHLHDSSASRSGDQAAGSSTGQSDTPSDTANEPQQQQRAFSNFRNSRSVSLDDGVRSRYTGQARWNHSCVNQAARQPDFLSERELKAAVNRIRQWNYTEAGLAHLRDNRQAEAQTQIQQSGGVEFSVASYNVLAQCLLEENVGHLYPYCRSEDLDWTNRRRKLMDEFRRTDTDVLCLQEVQCDHYDTFFVPQFAKLGYKGLYKKRTGGKKDGCAIFFRERIFELERSALIEYHRAGLPILNRDNVALVAVLRAKNAKQNDDGGGCEDEDNGGQGSRLCVANTHLLFNPGRGDIRLAQMRILFAELDRMAFWRLRRSSSKRTRNIYHPIIVCGDMNSRPHCHLYKFISTGSLEYEGLAAGDISGEHSKHKSPKRGRTCLEKEFVPSELGITDQCQYLEINDSRKLSRSNDQLDDANSSAAAAVFSSGLMTHGLNLVSVYGHRIDDDQPEVTTHHDRASCTVDYIFYSVKKKQSKLRDDRVVHERVKEGRLNLLATYALPTSEELRSIGGLPNAVLASDHVQLVAKFLLKTE